MFQRESESKPEWKWEGIESVRDFDMIAMFFIFNQLFCRLQREALAHLAEYMKIRFSQNITIHNGCGLTQLVSCMFTVILSL